jgi:hypothetical protein
MSGGEYQARLVAGTRECLTTSSVGYRRPTRLHDESAMFMNPDRYDFTILSLGDVQHQTRATASDHSDKGDRQRP